MRDKVRVMTDWAAFDRLLAARRGGIVESFVAFVRREPDSQEPAKVRQTGASRVNVKLILDGEEEIGSPYFGAFCEKNKALLAADVVIITDGPKHASGRPTIAGGARGVGKIELELEAARRDLHSGNYAVPNPAWKLNGLLSSMATPDGLPLIEGFEEDVVGPTAAEKKMMTDLPLDLPALEKELGVKLASDYLDRIMFHPTLTIRGLHSGFLGKEANTI